jgi:hypothetical protein
MKISSFASEAERFGERRTDAARVGILTAIVPSSHYSSRLRLILNMFSLLALLAVFVLSSCSKKSHLSFNALQPSPVTLPEHVKTLALVNRTLPQNTKANVVEGILTGEGMYEDKSGVTSAFAGLNTVLRNSPRYQIKQTTENLPGSGTGTLFPAPLSWQEVNRICEAYQADAICTIETYDTDVQIIPGVRILTGNDGLIPRGTQFKVDLRAEVKIGFRVYDPAVRSIQDEFRFTHQLLWTAGGLTPEGAIAALIEKRAATDRVSYLIGEQYASRITPIWIRLHRTYYNKGGRPEMKQAYRMAYVNDWEGAAQIWEMIVNTSTGKTAGRAAYNRAIAAEVMGRLEEAKFWASKAYTIYGDKLARDYNQILDRRIQTSRRLDNQMRSASNDN